MKCRQIWAWILCICLIFTALPVTGKAEESQLDSGARQLKLAMLSRADSVSFTIKTEEPLIATGASPETPLSEEMLKLLSNEMYALAMEHTGTGTEGDYLYWQMGGWGYEASYFTEGSTITYSFTYYFTYYTSADQEAALAIRLQEAEEQLALEGKTDYEKLVAIYEYICSHVAYDYENLENEAYRLKYTAYAALIEGTAVCQGYANLFYRMANDQGIDTRIVTGIGNGGPHAWNIVKLDGLYYNLDSTWDAGATEKEYFLKGGLAFREHERDDKYLDDTFVALYPMAEEDYVLPELPPETEPTEETEPPTEPTEVTEPSTEPTEVTEPATEPTEVTEPATEPTEITEPSTEPTEETEPSTEPTEVTEPSTEPTEVTEPSTEPTEVTEPATEPTEVTEPATEPTEVTEPSTEPTEITEPSTEPTEETEPSTKTTEVTESPTEPTEVTKPPAEPPKEDNGGAWILFAGGILLLCGGGTVFLLKKKGILKI